MDWNNTNTNNQKSMLKANGPYRIPTTDNSAINGSRLDGATKPQTLGEIKVYGEPVEPKSASSKTYTLPDPKKDK